jgi:hypothetical protein
MNESGRASQVNSLLAALALLPCATASAQQVACADLRAVLDTAKADFAPIRGPLRLSVVPALADFEEHVYATQRPLDGAASCEIRTARMKDEAASLQQASYRCTWSSNAGFTELKRLLVACIENPVSREEDPESLHLYVDRVDSGEGYDAVLVAVDTNATQNVVLNVSRVTCLNRSPGGCEDE